MSIQRWTDQMLDELATSVSEIKDSISEVKDSIAQLRDSDSQLRESIVEMKDSIDGLRVTSQALLQVATQQQRNEEARRAEMEEFKQRQSESDRRFKVLLAEVRYLIRQIKPTDERQ